MTSLPGARTVTFDDLRLLLRWEGIDPDEVVYKLKVKKPMWADSDLKATPVAMLLGVLHKQLDIRKPRELRKPAKVQAALVKSDLLIRSDMTYVLLTQPVLDESETVANMHAGTGKNPVLVARIAEAFPEVYNSLDGVQIPVKASELVIDKVGWPAYVERLELYW